MDIDPRRLYVTLGKRVREEREKRGWLQADLAARIGVGRTSLTNIERGNQRLLLHLLYRLADVFQVTPADLLPASEKVQNSVEALAAATKPTREWAESVIAETSGASNANH